MMNEEKAIELVKQFQSCINNGVSIDAAVMACLMEMAEWKDEQFNEEKKDLLELVNMLECNEKNQTIIEDLKALLS